MKIKLVQFNFGREGKYQEICNLTDQINEKYCQLYGYEHQFDYLDKSIIEKIFGSFTWEYGCAYKIHYIYDKLMKQDCDILVFVDADAAVSKPTIKIEELMDEEHDLYLSRGNEKVYAMNSIITLYNNLLRLLSNQEILKQEYYDQTIMKNFNFFSDCERLSIGWIFQNEGFYIIKNTPLVREFFKDCVDVTKYFIHRVVERGRAYEGLIMDFVLLQEKYNKMFTFMYDQAQGGAANSFETAYNVEKTFILHNYGQALTTEQKIDWIKTLKQNKWWKPILEKEN